MQTHGVSIATKHITRSEGRTANNFTSNVG